MCPRPPWIDPVSLLGIPEAFDLSFVCSSVEDKSLEKEAEGTLNKVPLLKELTLMYFSCPH